MSDISLIYLFVINLTLNIWPFLWMFSDFKTEMVLPFGGLQKISDFFIVNFKVTTNNQSIQDIS